MMHDTLSLEVLDSSAVGEGRRLAGRLTEILGFSEAQQATVSLVVSELATNLTKHSQSGQLLLSMQKDAQLLDVLSIDKGPGMSSIALCMQDGYSSVGTAGGGLGAIARHSQQFDIHSEQDLGTVILSRFSCPDAPTGPLLLSSANIPFPGEELSGDAVHVIHRGGSSCFLIVDGLGHGEHAHHAAALAVANFESLVDGEPGKILEGLHRILGRTRGAAAAVAKIDPAQGEGFFSGIGNISAFVHGEERIAGLISSDGIVGHNAKKFVTHRFVWEEGSALILHTDGLSTRNRLDKYPALAKRHPGLIAGLMMRDTRRGRDDAAILVCKNSSAVRLPHGK